MVGKQGPVPSRLKDPPSTGKPISIHLPVRPLVSVVEHVLELQDIGSIEAFQQLLGLGQQVHLRAKAGTEEKQNPPGVVEQKES